MGGGIGRRLVVTTVGFLILAAPLSDSQKTLSRPVLERPPVVIVVFDELPLGSLVTDRGQIDPDLFPHFAKLAGDSTWFRNTVTGATFTQAAIPALLTGTYPERPVADDYVNPRNLFTLLQNDYDIHAPEDLPGLCPENLCSQPEDRVARAGDRFGRFATSERGRNFLAFRELLQAPRQDPALYFLHLVFPHSPWRYLPSGQDYPEVEPMPGETNPKGPGGGWSSDSWLVVQGLQRHLLQTQLADRLLGALVSELKKKGLYGRALVVVTADHGIAFEQNRPKRMVREKTAEHLLPIPFFMKLPSQNAAVTLDHVVEITDILPTVADALDVSAPWREPWSGHSAFRARASQFVKVDGVLFRAAGDPVNDLVAMKYRAFGESSGRLDLFEVGPGLTERLVGRPVHAAIAKRSAGTWATITSLDALQAAGPDDPTVPALIEGSLSGLDAHTYSKVAVSINGRVVAVTRTGSGKRPQFYALIDPKWLSDDGNKVGVYLIDRVDPAKLTKIRLLD